MGTEAEVLNVCAQNVTAVLVTLDPAVREGNERFSRNSRGRVALKNRDQRFSIWLLAFRISIYV